MRLLAATVIFLSSCATLPHDSPPEEAIEAVIREETGLDIDLTSEDGK